MTPTKYEDILKSFHSKFQSKTEIFPELEKQFFLTALGDFEIDLYPLEYDEDAETIEESLSRPEINVLGLLMYKAYLGRERDRILKLNNIIGRDIKLTGMGNSKSQINKAYEEISGEVAESINKLKDNSFYE